MGVIMRELVRGLGKFKYFFGEFVDKKFWIDYFGLSARFFIKRS
jgi:hypothetical protein